MPQVAFAPSYANVSASIVSLKRLIVSKTSIHLSLMTKPTKWFVRPAKTQISLGIRPVWSESSQSTRRKLGYLATHWVHSEDSNQTGRMPRLIRVFAGSTVIFLVLSWGGSIFFCRSWRYEKFCVSSFKLLSSCSFTSVAVTLCITASAKKVSRIA